MQPPTGSLLQNAEGVVYLDVCYGICKDTDTYGEGAGGGKKLVLDHV